MKWLSALTAVTAACTPATSSRSPGDERPAPTVDQADPGVPTRSHTAADVHFMAGMIAHHAQALLMAGWAMDSLHQAGSAVRTMSERMVVSQQDEIAFLERWLRERAVPQMEHDMLMPGMLTLEQLAQLDRARGPEFDRRFLTLMIQHHQGAITMVEQLLSTKGAAQDGSVFQFAAEVHADQTAEIERMRRLLTALLIGGTTP